MENVSYDLYVCNGGLIPRSVVIRKSNSSPTEKAQFLAKYSATLKEIESDFLRLARRGTHLDEIQDTHPVVDYILRNFLGFTSTADTSSGRFDRPDFVGGLKNSVGIPIEAKAFYYRDLGRAHGSKEGETATQQIARYIQKKGTSTFGSLDVGILTNGRDWRLQDTRGNYIEFDLEALVRDALDSKCDRNAEAISKLRLFQNLFGANVKFRRSLLFEGSNIWSESYTAFRQRYSSLLREINEIKMSEKSLAITKELSLWLIFIRSLEDLGSLPASPLHSGSDYYKYQLISHENWARYSDTNELSRFIKLVVSNKFSDAAAGAFTKELPEISSIENWAQVYKQLTEFLFMSDGQTPYDFGDLYSREFGMIYVNLIADSREHSAYFTSPRLAIAAAGELDYSVADGNFKTFDAACGSGTLLRAVFEHKLQRFLQNGAARPTVTSFFGSDIEPLSVLLCKMNLWIGSAKRGQPLPNLDRNIKRRNLFEAWEELAISGKTSLINEVWSDSASAGDHLVFIANPPWGESSSEVGAVKNRQRSMILPNQRELIEKVLQKSLIDTYADNLYIPFVTIPLVEARLSNRAEGSIQYAFILPDQFYVGTQRAGLRKSMWATMHKYFCYNNNRAGHFEGSVMGDDPDPNMRFGVVFGKIGGTSRSNQLRIAFPETGKTKQLPSSCRTRSVLPLFTSEFDLNCWRTFFDSRHSRIALSWHKGEINRKGSNRELIKEMKTFGGKDACRVVCSSQGQWKQLFGKHIDPKALAQELSNDDFGAQKKLKLFLKKRMVVPSQLSSGTGNTYSRDRVIIDSKLVITDNWHWIDSTAKNYEKIQKILDSAEWSSISRAMATRQNLPISLLNSLGLPDIDVSVLAKVS